MNLLQAIAYFLEEALIGMGTSWRASLVAVATCALSLYVGAFFFLITDNLSRQVDSWQQSLKVSIYLDDGLSVTDIERIRAKVELASWIESTTVVTPAMARERFAVSFSEVASALGDSVELDLPASIEAALGDTEIDESAWTSWLAQLAQEPGVQAVDDDRTFVRDVHRLTLWVRSAGLALSLGLLVAAAFTIAAVVRLTAYRYLDEISVLRLVGATEFYVRGPFVMEGLLQGLAGSALAVGALRLTHLFALERSGDSLWIGLLFERFLAPGSQVALVALGGLAGLAGSVLSIRRESLELDEESKT